MTDEPVSPSPLEDSIAGGVLPAAASALGAFGELVSIAQSNYFLPNGQRKRLADIATALRSGKSVPVVTVRVFLDWFWHSQRRGSSIVSWIRSRLKEAGLITVPDFESTYLDAEIEFQLAPSVPTTKNIANGPEVVKVEENSEVSVSSSVFADPTYRISKLAAANQIPLSVKPDATVNEAVTLMIAHDYSQLPVMTSEWEVKGMTSWNAIGMRLAIGQNPKAVREAMEPHAEVSSDASLFNAIPIIVEHGYALVRSSANNRIVGIVTTSDLSLQFQQLSEPFLLLGEIENHIRRIIDAKLGKKELEAAKDAADQNRVVGSASDLTFGEYKQLLENPKHWDALHLSLDRGTFIKRLETVRLIRNDVMHFDPDGIAENSLRSLREFAKFLRALQSIGAT